MKRLIIIFAVLLATTSMMAQDTLHIGDLYYEMIPDEAGYYSLKVVYHKNCNYHKLKSLTIPKAITHQGMTLPVTGIGNGAFWGCKSLRSIVIPNSVKAIEDWAFWGCHSLTSVSIPNSVITIGQNTFADCMSLSSITIPKSVISIGDRAFVFCKSLTSIRVDTDNTHYDSRNNCNAIIKTSTNTLILGCKKTIIPESVTSIGHWAFFGCKSLRSITIPNSVISIDNWAFDECKSLTSITIPRNVTSIGQMAFADCKSLKTIVFDGTIEQWQAIEKHYDWNDYTPATHVQCTDGDIEL